METIEAYNNQLTLLCGVGVRAILESICKNKGVEEGVFTNVDGAEVKSKALNGKIYGLAAKGFLTSDNAMILHELRFLGNAAVHELSSPTIESLQIAVEIIEHVIDNIYELSYKAGKLMEKRTGSA